MKRAIVVGFGNVSVRHRKNLKTLFPEVFITAVSSSGKIKAQNTDYADQIVLNLNEVELNGVDMAIIASPSTFHELHAKFFLLAGIPILIEKPITSCSEDAYKLLRLQKETQTPVAVGYCLRYMSSAIKMKELLVRGSIGKIYNALVEAGQYLPYWRPSKNYLNSVSASESLGGGALLEFSHELDYLQWLLGPLHVQYAQIRSSEELNLEVEEIVDLVLVSDAGSVCSVHLDFLQKKSKRVCSFIGEKGRLDWDLLDNKIVLNSKNNSEIIFYEDGWHSNEMYLSMLKDFLKLIEKRQNSTISLDQAAKSITLIETIKNIAIKGIKQ